MRYLTHRAAKDYLWSLRACYSIGLASWTETLDRLLALCQMCSPSNPARVFAERMLRLEEWPIEADWARSLYDDQQITDDSPNAFPSRLRRLSESDSSGSSVEEPPIWLYLVSSASGLGNWEFHQYDDDPYPSVPHGHKRSDHKWKLDAYQGWVFERTRQDHREPRWKIVLLWNDSKFRGFALDAIEYYIDRFPHHNDWRVGNPLRLPRRR